VGFDRTVSLPNVAIALGGTGTPYRTVDSLPHHLVLRQVVAGHGCPAQQLKRTVAGNAAHLMIVDSWLDGAKKIGQEAQAFQAHNTPGPILVRNTYLAGVVGGQNWQWVARLVIDSVMVSVPPISAAAVWPLGR